MTKGLWQGIPIEQLSREQLEDALIQTWKMFNAERIEHQRELDVLSGS